MSVFIGKAGGTSSTPNVNLSYALTSAVGASANTVIKMDTQIFDTNSAYSTSTGLFTAPVAGVYRVSFTGTANSPTTPFLRVNGADYAILTTIPNNNFTASGSLLVKLALNDTVGVYSNNGGVTYAGISVTTWETMLCIERVGS